VIYSLLRSAAGIALRWYYADVTFVGVDRIPDRGPILVVVNHPNALVDVLVAARAVPRQLRFTAKATLFANPFTRALFHSVGVLPLRRASDESASGEAPDPSRNAQAFAAVAEALEQSAAVHAPTLVIVERDAREHRSEIGRVRAMSQEEVQERLVIQMHEYPADVENYITNQAASVSRTRPLYGRASAADVW